MNRQSEVCRQLQNTVMEFCERTYSGVNESELEVDGIICISFANSCEQHVVKIHEILRNRCLYNTDSANSSQTHKKSSHRFLNSSNNELDQNSRNIEDMLRSSSEVNSMPSSLTSPGSALFSISGHADHKQNSDNDSHVMQSSTSCDVVNSGVETLGTSHANLTEKRNTNTEQNDVSVSDLLSYSYGQNEGLKKKSYRESVEGGCVIIKMEPEDSEEDNLLDSDIKNNMHDLSSDNRFSPEMRVSEHGTTSTVHSNSDFLSKEAEKSEMYMITSDCCDVKPDLHPTVHVDPQNSGTHQNLQLRMGTVWRNNHAPFDHSTPDQLCLPEEFETRYHANKFQYLNSSTSNIQNTHTSSTVMSSTVNPSNVIKSANTVESDCHLRKDMVSSFAKINTLRNRKPNVSIFQKSTQYSKNHRVITEVEQDISENKTNLPVSTINTMKGFGAVSPKTGLKSFGASHHQRDRFSTGQRERKYFCRTCGKGFTMKCTRTRHEKSICGSGGNNFYKCELCDKVFNRSDSRGRHMFKTHGIKGVNVTVL